MTIIFEIFEDLPRQGPGDDAYTRRAFEMLTDLPAKPEIMDVGCGAGTQTIALARLCPGRITAVDVHQPVLDELQRRAEAAGVADRVVPLNMSMTELDSLDETFDVVWSEGAIFIMGFQPGLEAWRPLLKPGGWLVLSEAVWFCDQPPAEVKAFWDACYPAITHAESNVRMAEDAGYTVVGTFRLPAESWFEFYRPLPAKLTRLRQKYGGDDAALSEIAQCEHEIEVFHQYPDAYGYQFFVLRKP